MDATNPPPATAAVAAGDKALAILCHVSPFLSVPFLLPFIVYLVKREESVFVAAHAKEALNFHLSLLLYCVCMIPPVFLTCGILIYPAILFCTALGLMTFICAIVAAIRASEGGFYLYPLTIRFLG